MESGGHTGRDKVNCGRVIFITNPATPVDGKSPKKKNSERKNSDSELFIRHCLPNNRMAQIFILMSGDYHYDN